VEYFHYFVFSRVAAQRMCEGLPRVGGETMMGEVSGLAASRWMSRREQIPGNLALGYCRLLNTRQLHERLPAASHDEYSAPPAKRTQALAEATR